jgi:flagellar hook-basal body complex protein FliE
MKKVFFRVLAVAMVFVSVQSFGQNSLNDVLNKAQSMINSGSTKGLADVLVPAGKLLQNELNTSDNEIKGKLLGQADALKGIVPALLTGKADLGAVGNIINKVKLLLAANQLKKALAGGKSGLAGNAGNINSALSLLKSGSSAIGSGNQKTFDKLLGSAVKSTGKLEKGGLFKNLRAKATEKKLTKLVSLVTSVI